MPLPPSELSLRLSEPLVPSIAKAGADWQVIRDRDDILALQPELALLAERCGQPSMMNSLDYFLSLPYLDLRLPHKLLNNIPYLSQVLSKARAKLPRLLIRRGEQGLTAAALLFEQHICGISTGVYVPIDGEVYRTVVAPPRQLAAVAREVGEVLLQRGGLIALVSYLEEPGESAGSGEGAREWMDPSVPEFWSAEHLIATDRRDSSCRLPLEETFDKTLAAMGQHTRRNLRAFQRRAERELGATYEPDAEVSLSDFLEINEASRYSVTEWMARWRYQSSRTVAGGSISGLRAGDGRWLSLIGSHAQAETVWLDWQMNREIPGSISLISAMRSYFIATQVERGMRWIHFEGGTPHSMNSAFVRERARDLLFARNFLSPKLLKRISAGISSTGPLATFLCAESLVWKRERL